MNSTTNERIEMEIQRLLSELEKIDPSAEDYKEITSRITDLYGTLNKEQSLEIDRDRIQCEREKLDTEDYHRTEEGRFKLKELKSSRVFNGIKIGVEVLGVTAPLVFYGIWMNRGLQFEEEGSFTSQTFKGLIGKFKPTK